MRFDNKEDIIQLTPLWEGERFENGRPRVVDDIITRMEGVSTEEAWGVLWGRGYKYQFQGDWRVTRPGKTLVGRAVTAVMVPTRPDLHNYLLDYGRKEEGRIGFFNSWAIETLQKNDVLVVDMFDKIYEGTFSGGNLSNVIARRTGRGQVIFGGIRDLQQVMDIPNFQTFYRGNDPTPIRDVMLIGINVPCRIGNAVCMPGDVVLGTAAGVLFIPPHLAEECVISSERTRLRELFGFQRIREGVYTSAQMDTKWTPEIEADFAEWRKTNTPDEFKHLVWDDAPKPPEQKPKKDEPTLL
jgi:regulator of RNase E activity RraA